MAAFGIFLCEGSTTMYTIRSHFLKQSEKQPKYIYLGICVWNSMEKGMEEYTINNVDQLKKENIGLLYLNKLVFFFKFKLSNI